VVAVAIAWLGARTGLARGMAARMVSERVGLPATVESLRIGLVPSPSIEIGGLAIAQPPGYGDEPLLTVGRLRLELPWGSLFGGSRLRAVEVSEATARLAVGADGVIYTAAGRTVLALNPDGTLLWQFSTKKPIESSPAIAADGTLFIGAENLYAFAP